MRTLILATGSVVSATVLALTTASPALAASGEVYSVGANARSYFNDQTDRLQACDRAENGEAAVAFFDVRQADGSWLRRGWVVDGNADGSCVGETVGVNREGAQLRLWSCEIRNGALNNCNSGILPGI
ncbi:hypothetical protein [Nocardioides plantarum]|uniref:Ricin B lectin domain-containing protein n=1 Tax=Nocardioides plantarum TaxID=29299 RepID=A0ABV5K4T8_9ACTN|nr:hypothetical protein [Nocardioides plantarum]